jgi:hypothetical protein
MRCYNVKERGKGMTIGWLYNNDKKSIWDTKECKEYKKRRKKGSSSARRIAKAILLALLDIEDEGTKNI